MDKTWMRGIKWSKSYMNGVNSFMQFVKTHMGRECDVRCPCRNCLNLKIKDQNTVKVHIMENGIDPGYVTWFYHGEPKLNNEGIRTDSGLIEENNYEEENDEEDDDINEMFFDLGEQYNQANSDSMSIDDNDAHGLPAYLEALVADTQTELYPGCKKISKTSFIIKLLHLKVYNKLSNGAMNMILSLMKSTLPDGETLPSTCYEAKRYLRDLGLGYERIDACKFDCVLFWNENKNLEACPTCGTSRWKINDGIGKKIPHKILRYFPVTPRLRRLFLSSKTSKKMVWHKEKRIDDDYMRHPADSIAWKDFDSKFPLFADDPRNVRLALAADGFNPFGNLSTTYSMWPVILAPLNLPPWDCMKQHFLMLSLLIPGKKSPGKDIDVYLQPLVKELTELWVEGAETFDVSCKQNFQMHAAVLWTINDFPAYGDLSGWITKGYMACPVCNEGTFSQRIRDKLCFMGHRCYLAKDHPWRRSKKFNGKIENGEPPRELSGDDVLIQLERLQKRTPGKQTKKRKRMPEELNWSKRSIFFDLPYWSKLKLRHNLDVMHIEKNICESILGTLMSVDGKTKDTIKARLDLEDMKIRKELHLIKRNDGKYDVPAACYVMKKKERHEFCEFLKSIKFPDGYASNISRCVSTSDDKISGLKSHDCHILLQRILPVGIRGSLNKNVSEVLGELGLFFQRLCCKKLKKSELHKMGEDIVLILCKFEQIFPPAFFDVMVHLSVHLPREALVGGPVQFRWMYPIERSLCELKKSVRNKAHPEGSIAEAYIAKECLTFCSMYLRGIETRFNRDERNNDSGIDDSLWIFSQQCRHFGATKYVQLSEDEFNVIQWYVYENCEEIEPYFEKHKQELISKGSANIDRDHKQQFPEWFKNHMNKIYHADPSNMNESLYSLACAPHRCVSKYTGCIVNGVRFLTKERDSRRKSQNSGIVVEGNHGEKIIDFYGVLTNIIKLDYVKGRQVTIFKCEWFDLDPENRKKPGIQKEENITSIRVTGKWYENDPFILADQARQVFYINDPKFGGDWRVVQPFHHRHIYDVDEMQDETLDTGEDQGEDEVYQENHIDDAFEISVGEIPSLNTGDTEVKDIENLIISSVGGECEEENIDSSNEDEVDDTIVDYCSSEEDSQKNSLSEDESDDDNLVS